VRSKPSPFLALAIAVACLTGCGPRDVAYQPSQFEVHAAIAPPDVAVPASLGQTPSEFDGLYLEGADSFSCCWIAPKATLFVRKRGARIVLIAGFRLPNVPRFRGGQEVQIRLPNDRSTHRLRLDAGQQHAMRIRLPSALQRPAGLIPIEITSTIDYVPSRDTPPKQTLLSLLHLEAPAVNGDNRDLGVVLMYLYFE